MDEYSVQKPSPRWSQPEEVLDLAGFRATPLIREPFDYLIVPGFLRAAAAAAVNADYPVIENPGSFALSGLTFGAAMQGLLDVLQGPALRAAFEEKFAIDLTGRPTMITVRGQSGTRDGYIHTDSTNKIITVLLYMNSRWEAPGGRLRLLRSADNIDDVLEEVPPVEGTLLAFRRSDNSWHGHKPFVGPRRVVQLNWVTDQGTVWRQGIKHRFAALVKKAFGVFARPQM